MRVAVSLVEGMVEPEIVREMRILTEIMVEDSLHFMVRRKRKEEREREREPFSQN
jgi:hypothetical protein